MLRLRVSIGVLLVLSLLAFCSAEADAEIAEVPAESKDAGSIPLTEEATQLLAVDAGDGHADGAARETRQFRTFGFGRRPFYGGGFRRPYYGGGFGRPYYGGGFYRPRPFYGGYRPYYGFGGFYRPYPYFGGFYG